MNPYSLHMRLYYTVKPIIPRRVQIFLRRRLAASIRKKCAHIWPIDPNAAKPPEGWQGWPHGKDFALVLSHDVETRKGYDNVFRLADLEERLGFRSTFNFVPERYGRVSSEVIDELKRRGFEVAVHGLKHDGKLYFSKRTFDRRALRINRYLRGWKAKGFTSPSMHHNLRWLAGLDILYSLSTFDTDPFEPQPDPAGTIFPFWLPNCSPNHGFVELPYTLPQDSTLFIILQEKTNAIWKRKLDWIAEYGGMALVNTHPDYMDFDGSTGDLSYPLLHYMDFLHYVQQRYAGRCYHALPSEIATIIRDLCLKHESSCTSDGSAGLDKSSSHSSLTPHASRRPLRIAMLTYSHYESDNRVRRYAETLVRRGDSVDVISLRRAGQANFNELNGVRIYRVQERVRDEKGKGDHLWRIMKFFFRSAALLTCKHLDRSYDLVHVHSVPDFEVFAALIPKILGAKIILDIHDLVPELYASKFNVKKQSSIFKALVLEEKTSIRFSDHAIVSNDLWRNRLISRSVLPTKCTSILNYPDDHLFHTIEPRKNNTKMVLLYPGTLNHHQGLDVAINAFAKIKNVAPQAEFRIYGDGPARTELAELIRAHDLQDRVFLKDPVPLDEIVGIMAEANIGVIPKKHDGFGDEAFSTKTLEFMILAVPIIVSRTHIDGYYFDDSIVKFFEPDNIEDMAAAMLELIRNRTVREALAANALEFAKKNCWAVKQHLYLNLVDQLCGKAN